MSKLTEARRNKIVNLYSNTDLTVKEISKRTKADTVTIYRVLRKNGVPLRSQPSWLAPKLSVPTMPQLETVEVTVYKSLPPYIRRGIDRILAERARTGAPTNAAHLALNTKVSIIRKKGETPEV